MMIMMWKSRRGWREGGGWGGCNHVQGNTRVFSHFFDCTDNQANHDASSFSVILSQSLSVQVPRPILTIRLSYLPHRTLHFFF